MGKAIEKIGKVSTESVRKCTGKSWDQWISLLNRAGAKNWQHREITLLLKTKFKLTPWWQQGVAIGFELYSGTRIEGRNEKGLFATVATKTFPISKKSAWALVSRNPGLSLWLNPFSEFDWKKGVGFEVPGGVFGEVRTVKPGERVRLSWQEDRWQKPSIVQLQLIARKGEKCVIVITHEAIPSAAIKLQLRSQWKEALERLRRSL